VVTESNAEPEGSDDSEPQLQGRVTTAITEAFFAELAEVGYGKLSVDSIVKRAGVGKAAVYRRWPTKKAMVVALITEVASNASEPQDTGSFEGDVLALTSQMGSLLLHPLVNCIIPAIAAEAARNEELEKLLRDTVEGPRRQSYAELLRRGMTRGDLPADCDVDLALDFLIGPLYWRLLVRRKRLDPDAEQRLARGVVAAVLAARIGA
jgi:AcrR family transcriptional regulator